MNRISVIKKLVVYSVLFIFAAEVSYAVPTSQESQNALYRRGVDAGLLKSAAEEIFENVVEMRKLENRARKGGQSFQMGFVLTGASDLAGRIERISFRLNQLGCNISDVEVRGNLSIALQMLENIPKVNLAADRAELLKVVQILLGTLTKIESYLEAVFEGNYGAQLSQQLCLNFNEPQVGFQYNERSKADSEDLIQLFDQCNLQTSENNPFSGDVRAMNGHNSNALFNNYSNNPFSDRKYEHQNYDEASQQARAEYAQLEQANLERAEQAQKAINSNSNAGAATGFKEVIVKGLVHFGDYGKKPNSGVEALFKSRIKGIFRTEIDQSWKSELGGKKLPNVKMNLNIHSVTHLKSHFGFLKGYLVNFNSTVLVALGDKSKSYRKEGVLVYVDKQGAPKSKNAPFDAFLKTFARDLASGFKQVK
ncbi:MAG: hypothetical protein ABI041_11905 [Bdellovibrionia bacterium]